LGEQPEHLFEEAALRFVHLSEGQSDYSTKLRHVQYWRDQFRGRAMRSLTADEIVRALPTHSVHKMKQPTPLTGSTKNRYIATIKRILSLCAEWDWIDKPPKLPRYHEPDVRVRWEPPEVITPPDKSDAPPLDAGCGRCRCIDWSSRKRALFPFAATSRFGTEECLDYPRRREIWLRTCSSVER